VAEALIGLALLAVVSGFLASFWWQGNASADQTSQHCDAVAAVLVASEHLRSDAARMLLEDPAEDLEIESDGRAISFRVSRAVDGDPWTILKEPVSYRLEPVSGASRVHRLIREEGGGPAAPVPGCLLADMQIRVATPGDLSPDQAFLEVTLVGVNAVHAKVRHTVSILIPLHVVVEPAAYGLPGKVS
jgi:hypothetical protein